MEKWNQSARIARGAPSGLMVSLLLHAVAIFIAVLWVVIIKLPLEEPPQITGNLPPVRHPIPPKKPRVRIEMSAEPEPAARMVANVESAALPVFQIPDQDGTGKSLLDGLRMGGVFMDFPEITETTVGTPTSIGNDLEGVFYDFKRARDGHWIATDEDLNQDITGWLLKINRFIKSGFDPATLSRYYRSNRKMYARCLVVPMTDTSIGPSNFDTPDSGGGFWMVHYKGKLVHKDGITFRFRCTADYFIVIRVDGEIVWAGVWNTPERYADFQTLVGGLYSPRLDTRGAFFNNDRSMAGEWITLEPMVAKDIDIIIGDENGQMGCIIAVEEKDKVGEYEKNKYGQPIYPAFRTAALSHDLIDAIYKDLPEGWVCVTNGPIFRDF